MPEPKAIEKFEAVCGPETTQLEIHLWCLKQGDAWLKKRGRTSFYHHKEAQKLLWPKHDHHRWSDLVLKTFCEEEITVLCGCSDSSKTFSMATIILIDYWTDPENTLWLVSTTEGRGSELRIWGVIKDLFNEARLSYEFLEGNPIDHIKTITTGEIDDNKREARSLRAGIIIVPCKSGSLVSGLSAFIGIKSPRLRHAGDEVACFPGGTLVDTPSGRRSIERINVGDEVYCAAGIGTVTQVHKRQSDSIAVIFCRDGRKISCTPDHRIFTQAGWKSASHINAGDYMMSTCEAMSIVSQPVSARVQQSSLRRLSDQAFERAMSAMQSGVSEIPNWKQAAFLRHELSREMASLPAGISSEVLHPGANRKNYCRPKAGPEEMGFPHGEVVGGAAAILPGHERGGKAIAAEGPKRAGEISWPLPASARRERSGSHNFRESVAGYVSRVTTQFYRGHNGVTRQRPSDSLQTGRSFPVAEALRRGRWPIAHELYEEAGRPTEDQMVEGAWVDRVEIQESGNSKCAESGEGEIEVFNLSVDGHPSYSVNGFLVHNCMSDSFLNAYSNWYGKEDFKGIMAGNFMETDDPLGVAAEPEGGWDLWEDTGKTQTWRSKFYNAKVVALDGRDSPNFDFAPSPSGRQKYPYLIGPKKLKGVEETKGKNSWEWYSQCVGKPAKGADIWRVLTKDFCLRHHASEDVVWMDDKILNLYALDPAYGGGDRCVGRQLQLGKRLDGVQTLLFHPPEIIPIRLGIEVDAEAQIAAYVYHRAKELKIAAKDIFYDSFGRGTLGFEFAKLFGLDCPNPVDSGAVPTSRPVRFDLFVEERDGTRRLKRCDEHYRKFISEMYFSVYEAIDSDQVRGLDLETIREGCSRKFTKNKRGDNKIEVEPKDDYKERNRGQSPDLCDNAVIGCEGARRRGFKIVRLGADVEAKKPKPKNSDLDTWLEEKSQHDKAYELQLR